MSWSNFHTSCMSFWSVIYVYNLWVFIIVIMDNGNYTCFIIFIPSYSEFWIQISRCVLNLRVKCNLPRFWIEKSKQYISNAGWSNEKSWARLVINLKSGIFSVYVYVYSNVVLIHIIIFLNGVFGWYTALGSCFFGVQRIVYLYTMLRGKTHKRRDAFVCAVLLRHGTCSRQEL